MTIEQLKALLAINKNELDTEISNQPSLFYEVAEACVSAMAERDARKEELATVDAELDGKARVTLSQREERVTEAMVKNAVQSHKDHEQAFEAYMEAKTKSDLFSAMKDSFGQRGYMLRDMVQLYVASYFEQPSVRGDANADRAVYDVQRERLGQARRNRIKTEPQ